MGGTHHETNHDSHACPLPCRGTVLPASALEYTIDAPDGPDYGKPTSVEVVHTADGGARKNEDVSKNAALIPPVWDAQHGYQEHRELSHA